MRRQRARPDTAWRRAAPASRNRATGNASSGRFRAPRRIVVAGANHQPEQHHEIVADAAYREIDARRGGRKAAQHEGDHDDVPGRSGAHPGGEVQAVKPGEQPAVPAGIGVGAAQQRAGYEVEIISRMPGIIGNDAVDR